MTLIGVAAARVLDELSRQRLGLIEPARLGRGVSHAERGVEHDDPMRPLTGDHGAERLEKRLGHRRDDQEDHQRPDRQEQPLCLFAE